MPSQAGTRFDFIWHSYPQLVAQKWTKRMTRKDFSMSDETINNVSDGKRHNESVAAQTMAEHADRPSQWEVIDPHNNKEHRLKHYQRQSPNVASTRTASAMFQRIVALPLRLSLLPLPRFLSTPSTSSRALRSRVSPVVAAEL